MAVLPIVLRGASQRHVIRCSCESAAAVVFGGNVVSKVIEKLFRIVFEIRPHMFWLVVVK